MGEFSLSGQHHALLPIALFILVFVHPEYTIDFLLNYNSPITPQGGGKTIMEKCINKSPYIYNGHRSTTRFLNYFFLCTFQIFSFNAHKHCNY